MWYSITVSDHQAGCKDEKPVRITPIGFGSQRRGCTSKHLSSYQEANCRLTAKEDSLDRSRNFGTSAVPTYYTCTQEFHDESVPEEWVRTSILDARVQVLGK
ncbi:hypothetical protein ES702_03429 [subsurface metagenome]